MSESQQLLRQWNLLQTLAASRIGVPLRELAKEFETSDRTINRDLAILRSAGFPLEELIGPRRQKRWKMKPFSEQLQFNFEDLMSLLMTRRFLEPFAGSPFWEGHQRIFRKVRGALGEHAIRFCDRLQQVIRVSRFGGGDYSRRGQIIDTLMQAMEERKRVLIVYQSIQSTEAVEQEIGPLGIFWHAGSLYSVAWSARRQEIRQFKVDRMLDATIGSDLKYAVPENFSMEDWQKNAFGAFQGNGAESWTVRIHFHQNAARYVQESWWHDSQQFSPQSDGSLELTLQLSELSAVTKWILSFGRNAVALEPPELIESIRVEIQHLTAHYAGSPDRK